MMGIAYKYMNQGAATLAADRQRILNKALYAAIREKYGKDAEAEVAALLAAGADANAPRFGRKGALLVQAVKYIQTPQVIKLLVDHGARFEDAISTAKKDRLKAIYIDRLEFLRDQLAKQTTAPVQQSHAAKTDIGPATQRALDVALDRIVDRKPEADAEEQVKALLEAGANANAGTFPAGIMLARAVDKGHSRSVIKLLVDHGASFRDTLFLMQAYSWPEKSLNRLKCEIVHAADEKKSQRTAGNPLQQFNVIATTQPEAEEPRPAAHVREFRTKPISI